MKILIIEDDFIFGERLKKLIDEKLAGKKNGKRKMKKPYYQSTTLIIIRAVIN